MVENIFALSVMVGAVCLFFVVGGLICDYLDKRGL